MPITPINEWLTYEEVTLPSGRTVGLRQVDVLSILTRDGRVPNLLKPLLEQELGNKAAAKKQTEVSQDDFVELTGLLNNLARACFVEPAIVNTMEEVRAGKGITVDMIPYPDKVALIAWGMGGQDAVNRGKRFLVQQTPGLGAVSSGSDLARSSEPTPEPD